MNTIHKLEGDENEERQMQEELRRLDLILKETSDPSTQSSVKKTYEMVSKRLSRREKVNATLGRIESEQIMIRNILQNIQSAIIGPRSSVGLSANFDLDILAQEVAHVGNEADALEEAVQEVLGWSSER